MGELSSYDKSNALTNTTHICSKELTPHSITSTSDY